jgi:hypothetical protein
MAIEPVAFKKNSLGVPEYLVPPGTVQYILRYCTVPMQEVFRDVT